jgi:hypothetical protein
MRIEQNAYRIHPDQHIEEVSKSLTPALPAHTDLVFGQNTLA